MIRCFADTSFYISLVSADDEAHERAATYIEAFNGAIITTAWVLNELANFLAMPPNRELFLEILLELQSDDRVTIVSMDQSLFDRGIKLYGERLDKEWSVTDCISFLVMGEQGITDALTADHHFEQAGFKALLK